jgi:glutathione S-transferase
MKLYDYGASCNCYKVRLLLSQLGIEYERVPVDIFDGGTLTEDFGRMNPARTTPVLETDDGRFLQESNAILVYLAEGTPLLPGDRFERAQVMRWLIYEQTDVIPTIAGLRFRLLTGRVEASEPRAVRRREGGIEVLNLLEEHLSSRDYFAGDRYSIADIAVYGYTHRSQEAGVGLGPFAHVSEWLERVESQPGYIENVEPYPANARPGAGRSIYG